ncbi:DNA adenine methylase [Candidatus Altiarchaeota archaeon]
MTSGDFDRISVFKYSGNKQSHLEHIIPTIEDLVPHNGRILDLFAGTHSVGYALKKNYTIYANDAQAYSYIVGKALIENNKTKVSKGTAKTELLPLYEKNLKELTKYYGDVLKREREFIEGKDNSVTEYKKFEERFPHTGKNRHSKNPLYLQIVDLVNDVRANYGVVDHNIQHNPYCLFSTYFANHYWGIRQSMEIDSLRYAIAQIAHNRNANKVAIYLTSLLYAMSLTISGSFHTAEHPQINRSNYKNIIKDREKSVISRFYDKVEDINNKIIFSNRKNKCWNEDFAGLLSPENEGRYLLETADLVYIDPPYNSAHYSRFYHSFETMVKYDYPKNEYKGRYREDRLLSDFCRASKVKQAFHRLLERVSEISPKAVISYSTSSEGDRTEMMSIDEIKRLGKKFYSKVKSKSWKVNHSSHTQNGSTFKRKKEHLIICEN